MTLTQRFGIAVTAASAGLVVSLVYLAATGFEISVIDLFMIQLAYVVTYVPTVAVSESYLLSRLQAPAAHPVV